jgi:hypothetical protein
MTPVPNAVSVDQSVIDARERMQALGVHHLPVMEEGQLVGVVTERELRSIVDLGQADPAALAVGEVVSRGSCMTVAADTPLIDVVRDMADRGADCCAVIHEGQLAGILTTHDTLRLLVTMLSESGPPRGSSVRPSAVRERILSEHQVLRSIYEKTGELAQRVLASDLDAQGPLRERCRELYETLLRHIELENAILAPALHEADAFGAVRADELLQEHRRQRALLLEALDAADDQPALELAESVTRLIVDLHVDMAHEERALLDSELLKDDPISVGANSG